MAKSKQKDNSTYQQKILIRQRMRDRMNAAGVEPIIMETFGGYGKLFSACYTDVQRGVVFDKDPDKAARLALQRPTWAVYEADCEAALSCGAGAHLMINALDVDSYGSPFETIAAYFESNRPRSKRLWVVVNDGLRQNARLGDAWSVEVLKPAVAVFGNQLDPIYLEACRFLMELHARKAGYKLDSFAGYYCGSKGQICHYLSELSLDN
jgi:hypothetical protein